MLPAVIAIGCVTSFIAGYLFRPEVSNWTCTGGWQDTKGFHCGKLRPRNPLLEKSAQIVLDVADGFHPATDPEPIRKRPELARVDILAAVDDVLAAPPRKQNPARKETQ
jgi:hypothetical protein